MFPAAPPSKKPPVLTSQAEAERRIAAALPAVLLRRAASISQELGGKFIVAGGAVLWAVTTSVSFGDADFFPVGFPSSAAAATATWRLAYAAMEVLGGFYGMHLSGHALTLHFDQGRGEFGKMDVQITLCNFPTVSYVLHSFDLDPCRVALDPSAPSGLNFLATRSFLRALATGLMVVGPWTMSSRVVKYQHKGFQPVFPERLSAAEGAAVDAEDPGDAGGVPDSGGIMRLAFFNHRPSVSQLTAAQACIWAVLWSNSRPDGWWRWMSLGDIPWYVEDDV
ncbi:hypothetical protein PLESTF_001492800 [Pleodorina starrii]|nr:hypothetical protein PLESTF_001492800 [Pleodorina starrii]